MAGRSGQKLRVQHVSLVEQGRPPASTAKRGTTEEIEEYLWNVLRSSTEERSIDVECDKCPKYKHRVIVTIAGGKDGIAAAKELWDRTQGKATVQKAPPSVAKREPGVSLKDLTDEQIAALILAED